MLHFLFQCSELSLFVFLSTTAVIFSIFAIILVHYFVPLKIRVKENPVIGNVSAMISLIYGVLAGLIALYLINGVNYATEAVHHEANAAANILRDSAGLKEPTRTTLKNEVKHYLQHVIQHEWPNMMQNQKSDFFGRSIIKKISAQLLTYPITTASESAILPGLLNDINHLYDARQQRIQSDSQSLGFETWLVIAIGTLLTISINYLFGMHFYLHAIVVTAAALMASSMVFLLITLNKPFQGESYVTPEPLQMVLDEA